MNVLALKTYMRRRPPPRKLREIAPLECWEEILRRARQEDLRAASLVCKDFLRISIKCVNRINLTSYDLNRASQVFNRFKFIKEVNMGRYVTDGLLNLIRVSVVSLTSISLYDDDLYSLHSLMELFRHHQNLKRVALSGFILDSDKFSHIHDIFPLLPEITHLTLDYQNYLRHSNLVGLSQNCPLLEELQMSINCLERRRDDDYSTIIHTNENVRSLRLCYVYPTSDTSALMNNFASYCPNLETLTIGLIFASSTVEYILMNFSRLRRFTIKFLGDLEFSPHFTTNLEILTMRGSPVKYKTLKLLSKVCPKLKKLEIQYYLESLTKDQLRKVVKDFKELRSLVLICPPLHQVTFALTFLTKIKPSLEVRIEYVDYEASL